MIDSCADFGTLRYYLIAKPHCVSPTHFAPADTGGLLSRLSNASGNVLSSLLRNNIFRRILGSANDRQIYTVPLRRYRSSKADSIAFAIRFGHLGLRSKDERDDRSAFVS